jgi:hypothetical protein
LPYHMGSSSSFVANFTVSTLEINIVF